MAGVQFIGPWSTDAYAAANQMALGGSGVPFDNNTIKAANMILSQQPKPDPSATLGWSTTAQPPSDPTGSIASAQANAPVLNQGGIDNTQRAIDQLGPLLNAALEAERQRQANVNAEFAAQEQMQRKTYDTSTITNQQNYDANFMDSIRSGIKGLAGVMALLRGTGGGGGTAEDMARDTVGGVTANDIRMGADTQKENQVALDTSLSSFITDLDRKRRSNEDTLINNERAIRRDNATQMQDLFAKMAGFYGDVGRTADANSWMSKAGDLIPTIAKNSRAQVSAYDATPITVKAPELSAFAGPTEPNYAPSNDGQIGAGIFTMSDPRRRREQAAPVGV